MSSLYHISDSGQIAPCSATKRACPRGTHFDQPAAERIMNGHPDPSKAGEVAAALSYRDHVIELPSKPDRRSVDERAEFIVNSYGVKVNDYDAVEAARLATREGDAQSREDAVWNYLFDKTLLGENSRPAAKRIVAYADADLSETGKAKRREQMLGLLRTSGKHEEAQHLLMITYEIPSSKAGPILTEVEAEIHLGKDEVSQQRNIAAKLDKKFGDDRGQDMAKVFATHYGII
jgi:hypothetical protein